ncbi:MAG: alpha/beta hydrolase [Elusimicrobiota bacterium]
MAGPTSRFATGDTGHRIHLVDWGGSGPPVLLLHGMGGNTHWWDPVAPMLARWLRVIAMDLRGHGESDWTEPPRYSIADYGWDVEHARRAMGWDRFILAGHSLGARVALRYAASQRDRVESLALLDFLPEARKGRAPKARSETRHRQPSYIDRDATIRRFHLMPSATRAPRDLIERIARASVRRLKNSRWSWKFDWRAYHPDCPPVWEEAAEIGAPCLVLRGEKSEVMPRAAFDRVVDVLGDCVGVEVPGAHHHVTLDAPTTVARHLLEFCRPPLPSRGASAPGGIF